MVHGDNMYFVYFPSELHHAKAAGPTPMVTGAGTQSNSGLATVGGVGNRGLLLGPHITSIESFRGAPGMGVSGCGSSFTVDRRYPDSWDVIEPIQN